MISSLISLLFGKALRYPLITGLLLFSLVGMGWSYWQGRTGANAAFEKAKSEAILKNAKENEKLSQEAQDLIEKAKEATEKAEKKSDDEIEHIKNISPNQCLDVKLSDIGLQ